MGLIYWVLSSFAKLIGGMLYSALAPYAVPALGIGFITVVVYCGVRGAICDMLTDDDYDDEL